MIDGNGGGGEKMKINRKENANEPKVEHVKWRAECVYSWPTKVRKVILCKKITNIDYVGKNTKVH